jgi:hypothetical protein
MAEPTYDVLFAGELRGAASAEHVKKRLADVFKLDEAGIDRLFSGARVYIKRAVDRATADRFLEVFHKVGSVAEIVAVVEEEPEELFHFDDSDEPAPASRPPGKASEPVFEQASGPASGPAYEPGSKQAAEPAANRLDLSLAPPGTPLDELDDRGPEQNPDTSQLSLVEGDNWSLEDCAPPPLARRIADSDSLAIAPASKTADDANTR